MKARHYLILTLLWMCLIWLISSLPSDDIPSLKIFGIDKLAHWGIYFCWGLWAVLYLNKINVSSPRAIMVFSGMMMIAALDEYHQFYVPGRQVSIYDLFANWLGLLCALSFFYILKKRRHT
jgi:VanZ family protein